MVPPRSSIEEQPMLGRAKAVARDAARRKDEAALTIMFSYDLRLAPVLATTASTIFLLMVSISASVSVRSFG